MELSISQMASLHGLTRQTLIYYHKIGLFCPQTVKENGNRVYSPAQIPVLREICFLRKIGIPLKDIRRQLSQWNPENATALLEDQCREIEADISSRQELLRSIENRLTLFRKGKNLSREGCFTLEHLPRRKAAFCSWESHRIDPSTMHLLSLEVRQRMEARGILLSGSKGTLLRREWLDSPTPLAGACSFFITPETVPEGPDILEFPEGDYLCMYKVGMPYSLEPVYHLLDVAKRQGYTVCGDVIDVCLLDAAFYDHVRLAADFCQLQVLIS